MEFRWIYEGTLRDQEVIDDFLWWEDPGIPRLCMLMAANARVPVCVERWDILAGVMCKYVSLMHGCLGGLWHGK